MLMQIAEPGRQGGDPVPCHLFMAEVEWREPVGAVIRPRRWMMEYKRQAEQQAQDWMTPAEAALADCGYAVPELDAAADVSTPWWPLFLWIGAAFVVWAAFIFGVLPVV